MLTLAKMVARKYVFAPIKYLKSLHKLLASYRSRSFCERFLKEHGFESSTIPVCSMAQVACEQIYFTGVKFVLWRLLSIIPVCSMAQVACEQSIK